MTEASALFYEGVYLETLSPIVLVMGCMGKRALGDPGLVEESQRADFGEYVEWLDAKGMVIAPI